MAKFKCSHCYKTFKCDVPLKIFDETVCRECYDAYFAFVDKTNPYGGMATTEPKNDLINHPSHYTTGKVEVIDYIADKLTKEQFEGYCIGNVLKYVSRYRHKGGYDDLKKAAKYLDILFERNETKNQ